MPAGNKERLERYINQAENAIDRAIENVQKALDMYENKAPQQYDDLIIYVTVLYEAKDYIAHFRTERM